VGTDPGIVGVMKNSSGQRLFKRSRTVLKDILEGDPEAFIGKLVTVCGWVQTMREHTNTLAFFELNDGSCCGNLQVLIKKEEADEKGCLDELFSRAKRGVSVRLEGKIVESPKSEQKIEMICKKAIILGGVDRKASYPMPKKRLSFEYLRAHQTWRIRTQTMRAVHNIRNQCAWATHSFFQGLGFKYVHTPILTEADCEGAGEMFTVTTLLEEGIEISELPKEKDEDGFETERLDFSKDFFGKPVSLTVSGQLNVETYACALSDVYTFGPTFRAEHSNTSRHLAEFWMIEPEICFATLDDDMALAEDYVKYCVKSVLDNCSSDLEFLSKKYQSDFKLAQKRGQKKGESPPSRHIDSLQALLKKPYKRLTYTEAIKILEKEIKEHRCIVITEQEEKKMTAKDFKRKTKGKHRFENKVFWGVDLASEHEKYLTDKVFKGPVIVYNYPKTIKAFYMKMNEDKKTVQAMDMLVPGIGELIGGSAREDDYDKLVKRCVELDMELESLQWYLDLRKFGSVPHAGFGLGFERLVMLMTGMQNIKDVIPFPRSYGICEY